MDKTPPKLDVSAHDPVEVLMIVARAAGVDVPAGARKWLSASGPAPDPAEAAVYARLFADLRAAKMPEVARAALDDALDSARDDRRLAHVLGQATAPQVPDESDRRPQTDETGEAATATAERAGAADADADWFEAPGDDDPVTAFLAAAKRAGVPIPPGAAEWLAAPGPAPAGESWPYRTMITALAVAPLSVEVRTAVDRAQARARAVPGSRLADLLGAARQTEPTPSPTSRAVARAQARERLRSRLRPGAGDLHLRVAGGPQRQRPAGQLRRRLRTFVLAVAAALVAVAVGSAVGRVAPPAGELFARLGVARAAATPPAPAAAEAVPRDVVATSGGAVHDAAEDLVDAAVRAKPGRPGVAAQYTLLDASTGRTATVTTIAVREVVVDGAWVPADYVTEQLLGAPTEDGQARPWTPAPADVAPAPVGETFVLDGPRDATPVVRHGQAELTAGGGGTQRWLLVPSSAGHVAVVLTLPDGELSPATLQAADEQWLTAAARVLTRFAGADRDDVVAWVAEALDAGR